MESTVQFKGVEFDVDYNFIEGQKEIMYLPDGSGQEGLDSYVEIILITFQGEDFTEILERDFTEIEELIFEQLRP